MLSTITINICVLKKLAEYLKYEPLPSAHRINQLNNIPMEILVVKKLYLLCTTRPFEPRLKLCNLLMEELVNLISITVFVLCFCIV